MKKIVLCALAVLALLSLAPAVLMAQDDPPPKCCPPVPPGSGGGGGAVSAPLEAQAQIVVSTNLLQLQGLTRSQFLGRLSDSLFPGAAVDVILVSQRLVVQPPATAQDGVADGRNAGQSLIAVHQTLYYQVPRYTLTAQDLEKTDQLVLTDGSVFVTVTFARGVQVGTRITGGD